MTLSINEELRRTFEKAALSHEAKFARSPDQWREIRELKIRCSDARTREHDLYAERYEARVETRYRQLVDEAGGRARMLKPSFAAIDRFSPEDLLRQAQRDVRASHSRRLMTIADYESRRMAAMLERFDGENGRRSMLRDAFDRAADPGLERQRRRLRPRDG